MSGAVTTTDVQGAAQAPHSRWRRTASAVLRTGLYLLLALLLLLLVLMVGLPRALGWVPLTVLSGSMEPAVPVGSQVVVEPIESEQDLTGVRVGDVVAFLPEPDSDTLVTHRVVAQSLRADGSVLLTTRGDANTADDAGRVGAQQVRGQVRYHLPYAGYLASALTAAQKENGTLAAAALLFTYAGWQVIAGLRQRGRTAPPDEVPQDNGVP